MGKAVQEIVETDIETFILKKVTNRLSQETARLVLWKMPIQFRMLTEKQLQSKV